MTLTAFCDSCGKKIRVGKEYAGKKVKCLHCGHVLILPKREDFMSDPLAEFGGGRESRDDESEGRKRADQVVDVRDLPPGTPPPPPPAAAPPAPAEAHADDALLQTSDLVRGLQFGFGFWLAALPFLLLVVVVAWVLFQLVPGN